MAPAPRILLIKISSLGDVIHNLPVATDIRRAFPDAVIDWVCETPYAPLVALHPAVRNALPVSLRHLKRNLLSAAAWKEFNAQRARIAQDHYDCVLDTQGLVKSAWIARSARGPRCGYDAASAREPLASHLYQHRFHIVVNQHAVIRNRALAAAALGYAVLGEADYGLSAISHASPAPYMVFLHATSRADKQWSTALWVALAQELTKRHLRVVLPWGSDAERAESERIAVAVGPNAEVPARLSLPDAASLLAGAKAVVGVDTGLSHLAVAVGRPTIGLYCATDPGLTGLHGGALAINLGGIGRMPTVDEVLQALLQRGALN